MVVFAALIVASLSVGGVSYVTRRNASPQLQPTESIQPSTTPSGPTTSPSPQTSGSPKASTNAFPPGHNLGTWLSAHGKQVTKTCAVCHPPTKCRACHGLDMPHARTWQGIHGTEALARKATCLKCHSQTSFCDACHAKLAHGLGWFAKHGPKSKAGGATCRNCHAVSSVNACEKCHARNVHPSTWQGDHGKKALAANANCINCHKTQTAFCTACHGLVMPHASDWETAHRAAARSDIATCENCHTKQDCAACHDMTKVSTCDNCHATQVADIAKSPPHYESQCLTCHKQNSKVIGPNAGHMTKNPDCFQCHDRNALFPTGKSNAPRDWMKDFGDGPFTWPKRQQHSSTDTTCTNCHTIHDASQRKFPPGTDTKSSNCAPACHSRLDTSVVSRGLTNASGDPEQTTYRGTIDPGALINASATKHKTVVLAGNGCASLCHKGSHGTVTMCVSCHSYKYSDSSNLHATHIPFVSGEQQQADPGNFEAGSSSSACKYCHRPGEQGVKAGSKVFQAACWNCHLSGHSPTTPYWELPS